MLLIINIGSTSVKTKLFNECLVVQSELNVDFSTIQNAVITTGFTDEAAHHQTQAFTAVDEMLQFVLTQWQDFLQKQDIRLMAVGHRIVHGGTVFHDVTVIDSEMLGKLAQLDAYAPLHNPINRLGIRIAQEVFSTTMHYGVFDTAFHHRMPLLASKYPIPETLSSDIAIRRYGFHGISCSYVLHQAADLLKREETSLNLIVLHLGGGSSATAIRLGTSVDTSMGFSPLGGLIMGNRCGDLDPMVPMTLLRSGMNISELDDVFQRHSGMQAIAGTSDMRTILQKATEGNQQAQLAIDMYCYQIKKIIGAYYAILGSVSALIFTGGIGENCPLIRWNIVHEMEMMGLDIDADSNQQSATKYIDIAKSHCETRCFVIKCNEESEIARQISCFLKNV